MKWLLTLIAVISASLACAVDRALVVAVTEYQFLGPKWTLNGTQNDSKVMKDCLEKFGFKVDLLVGKDATSVNIAAKLSEYKKVSQATERVVVYFAGHGRAKPQPAIGPADGKPDGTNWIQAKTLSDWVKAIPATSRTVLLDSCFSGAMVTKGASQDVKSRFYNYVDPTTKSAGLESVDEEEYAPNSLANPQICYVTAAGANQIAHEVKINKGMPDEMWRGVFSYFLGNLLKDGTGGTWKQIIERIRSEMAQNMENLLLIEPQQPIVSDPFAGKFAFVSSETAGQEYAKPTNLLNLIVSERPLKSSFSFDSSNTATSHPIGEQVAINTKVGRKGYCVIVQQSGNRFQRIYPSLSVDECTPEFPACTSVTSDKAETVILKGLYFNSRDAAEQVLKTLPLNTWINAKEAFATQKDAYARVEDFYTATATYVFKEAVLGGLEIKDAQQVWSSLRNTDPLGQQLQAAILRFNPEVWRRVKDKDVLEPNELTTIINLVLQDADLGACIAEAKIPLKPELVPLTSSTEPQTAVKRNAEILLSLVPGLSRAPKQASP